MNIEQGLFKFDFTDHHAILGVSLDADAKQIRKRYLKIARRLHPDALAMATDAEKQQASELLSKLVNPAYEKLTQEKQMAEYQVVLRMKGQSLQQQRTRLELQTDSAKAVLKASNALNLYTNDLNKLAEQQYDSLEKVFDITGQISELNLAYLVCSADKAPAAAADPGKLGKPGKPGNDVPPEDVTIPRPPRKKPLSIIDAYLNRAKQFELQKDYPKAILEMREAVKTHPQSAPCHAQLANVYLLAGQTSMARIHLKRALEFDPDNPLANELLPKVNQANKGKSGAKKSSDKGTKGTNTGSRGGGLFGLFGGKQK